MDAGMLLWHTVSALFPLISVTFLGIFLAKKEKFDERVNSSLAKVYSNFFIPTFNFFNISGSLKIPNLRSEWQLLISPTIGIILGLAVSFTNSLIIKKKYTKSSSVVHCVLIFSNAGNLVVMLLEGVCSPYGPLNKVSYCDQASSYVAIQLITYHPIVWSYCWSLISNEIKLKESLNTCCTVDRTPFWKMFLRNLMLPAPVGCFLGVIGALIPGFQDLFFNKSSMFYSISKIGMNIGFAGIFIGQASLGSNLIILSKKSNKISVRFLIWIMFLKTVYMPLLAVLVVYPAWNYGIFGDNIVIAYIVYITFCSPTGLTTLFVCQSLNYGVKEATWLMISIYFFTLPSLMVFTYIFFLIIH